MILPIGGVSRKLGPLIYLDDNQRGTSEPNEAIHLTHSAQEGIGPIDELFVERLGLVGIQRSKIKKHKIKLLANSHE